MNRRKVSVILILGALLALGLSIYGEAATKVSAKSRNSQQQPSSESNSMGYGSMGY